MKSMTKIYLFFIACLFSLPSFVNGQSVVINEVSSGEDLIELYNTTNTDIDLEGYYLSDDPNDSTKWRIHDLDPNRSNTLGNIIEANGYIIIKTRGRNSVDATSANYDTNFKLSDKGETVYLYTPSQVLVDSLEFPSLPLTHSFGRKSDGSLAYFEQSSFSDFRSLSLPNVDSESYKRDLSLAIPVISAPYEIFNAPVQVEITSTSNTPIHYTLDGSNPDANSPIYTTPLIISGTSTLKCAHINAQGEIGRPALRTFLFNLNHSVAVVNITTEHYADRIKIGNFFDAPTLDGRIKIDFFEPNGSLAFEDYATFARSGGGGSSGGYQVNGKISINEESSSDHFNNHFFPNKPEIEKVNSFLLSNASQDQYRAHIRDVYLARVVSEDALINFGFEDSRPCVTYINGVYEGVLQMKEDDDKDFAEHNFPKQDPTNELLQTGDFWGVSDVAVIDSLIGLENLFFYFWHEAFIGGFEHEVNVFRFSDGTKYAASHDDDISLGIFEPAPIVAPIVSDLVDLNFEISNYIPPSLHAQMMQSWCSYSNFLYDPERTIAILDEMESELEPEMTEHTAYMKNVVTINPELLWSPVSTTLPEWNQEIDTIRQILAIRTTGFFDTLKKEYNLTDFVQFTASTSDKTHGSVEIEGVKLRKQTMSGPFFSQQDLHLKALPEPGFRFVEWKGVVNSSDIEITIQLLNDASIEAIFEAIPVNSVDLYVNEVQSKNDTTYADEFGEYNDWVEIYNAEGSTIDLAGYYLSDNRDITNKYEIKSTNSSKTSVAPNSFKIFWLDNDTIQGENHIGFKISGKDQIYLVYPDGLTFVDSLNFDLNTDQSYGAKMDGTSNNNVYFDAPTPDSTNNIIISGTEFINPENTVISLFPNPSIDKAHITLTNSEEVEQWKLVNSSGKIVQSGQQSEIDVTNLNAGVYLLLVNQYSIRLVKD